MNLRTGRDPITDSRRGDPRVRLLINQLECAEALKDLIKIMRRFQSAQQNYMLAERTYQNVAARVSELSENQEIGRDILKRMVRLRIALNAFAGVYAPDRQQGTPGLSVVLSQPLSD